MIELPIDPGKLCIPIHTEGEKIIAISPAFFFAGLIAIIKFYPCFTG
jgi:hypothetical protein